MEPQITRRRDPEAKQETWLIHYGDMRVGTIAERTGNPAATPSWQWSCGFYRIVPTRPPGMDASRMEALRDLWIGAGLEDVQAREITVHRTLANFDDFWMTNLKSPALRPAVAAMKLGDVETPISRVRARLSADADRWSHHLWSTRAPAQVA